MRSFIIVSNAISDSVRDERKILTDSPAATRKVFLWASLMRTNNIRSYVISMGRGRRNGSFNYYKAKVERRERAAVIYLPFSHIPIISELVTLFFLPFFIWRLTYKKNSAVVYYNRMPAYILGAILGCCFGVSQFIDLEDGEVDNGRRTIKRRIEMILPAVFDKLCNRGVFLACSQLIKYTTVRPAKNYYGVVDFNFKKKHLNDSKIKVIFSGTLTEATGANRLLTAIRQMRRNPEEWMKHIEFSICGLGDSLTDFRQLESDYSLPTVKVYGRLNDNDYKELLATSNVGLSLKPIGGLYADTTFPSKVVEYSSHNMLVITTDISDVKYVLGDDGAYYLKGNDAEELILCLENIIKNKSVVEAVSASGTASIRKKMNKDIVRKEMECFIFKGKYDAL